MNEETLNMQIRKFLKNVGVNSQREIETAVRDAIKDGRIKGTESLNSRVTLSVDGIGLSHHIDGTIELE